MKKLTAAQFDQMLSDITVPDHVIRKYLLPLKTAGGALNPEFTANPELISNAGYEGGPEELRPESALRIGSGWARWRRRRRFERRRRRGDDNPVIVSEGDSWTQFPLLLDDLVDHLDQNYMVWSLGAAGDDAHNMIVRDGEYMTALVEQAQDVRAFLFSGAGNDVIGEDEQGEPVIKSLLREQTSPNQSAEDLIDQAALGGVISKLRDLYGALVRRIRTDPRFEALPIIFHGYDYPLPYPSGPGDRRSPLWADQDQWLGAPMMDRNISDPGTRAAICRILIDALYDMLGDVAASDPHIRVVDLRGTARTVRDWADEIHPTSATFARMARKVRSALRDVVAAGEPEEALFESMPSLFDPTRTTIILDPGHGGDADKGGSSWNNAVGPLGTFEKDVTLLVGLATEAVLEQRGYRVLKTREGDTNKSLHQRAKLAADNAAQVFLSIHFNGWSDLDVQGTETYRHRDSNAASQQLAQFVQRATVGATGYRERGVKTAGFGVLRPDRHDPATAAALLEVSFLTDPDDEARLSDPAYIDRIATAIANGVEDYVEADAHGFAHEFERVWAEATAPVTDEASEGEGEDATSLPTPPAQLLPVFETLSQAAPTQFLADALSDAVAEVGTPGLADSEQFAAGWARQRDSEVAGVTFEAMVGSVDDSLQANFMTRGERLQKAVCKIEMQGGWSAVGSGFLIAPNILLTNNHVIKSPYHARQMQALFGYQLDENGAANGQQVYHFNPDRLFITSPSSNGLDYTFVWVDGAPHEIWGQAKFERGSFIAKKGDAANVVHHPSGNMKRVSVRENYLIDYRGGDYLIHYTSDTEPGSSGSPVFDDEWRLIGLHHAAQTLVAGSVPTPDGVRVSTLNEGIKMSAIALDLEARASAGGADKQAARTIMSHVVGTDSRVGYFGAEGRNMEHAGNSLERVVSVYGGTADDIDIAFWNIEWFNRDYHNKLDACVKVLADLKLDIWALSETSPRATEALVRAYNERFGESFDFAVSEPGASDGKQSTAVIWNTKTVSGQRLEWPAEVDRLLRLDSRDRAATAFEAVEGKIFNRYPALYRFTALNRDAGLPAFDFNLIPLHLKAKGEGAKRRRMAANILTEAVRLTEQQAPSERDWVIGGDFNAEIASGQFQSLTDAGFAPLAAADEQNGAFTYLGRQKSLIDQIFVSQTMKPLLDSDDFMIVALNRSQPSFKDEISDHVPVMMRLSLADAERSAADGDTAGLTDAPQQDRTAELLRDLLVRLSDDPAGIARRVQALLT